MHIYNTPLGPPRKIRTEPAPLAVPAEPAIKPKPKPKKKEKVPA